MLHLRQRGKIWYIGGTVKVGEETVAVDEFSSGLRKESDAKEVAKTKEFTIRKELLDGGSGRKGRLTIADCCAAYLTRPEPIQDYDKLRIGAFSEAIGNYKLGEVPMAWKAWVAQRPGISPGTLARERGILVSAINTGCEALDALPAPKVPGVKQSKEERVVLLSDEERKLLLQSYSASASRPATMLCHQGMRASEVLQLHWQNVDMQRQTIRIVSGESKSKRARTLPMHPDVYSMLVPLHAAWKAAVERAKTTRSNLPIYNHVFLSSRGEPYREARATRGGTGGNPIARAHDTACRLAGIEGFRVHDWRHDWAARMVIAGVDLLTIQRLGGWADLRMLGRYACFESSDHMQAAIMKIA
jgi:integrase